MRRTACVSLLVLTACVVVPVGCRVQTASTSKRTVLIDGSSTVAPISQAMAQQFEKTSSVKVSVGTSGTGGGFSKFSAGETDINNASRPIKASEIEACQKNGIEYLELKIAIDGLSVVVHPQNDWCKSLTVQQLKSIWEPESTVKKWKDVDPEWPDEPFKLYGADTDSGTFDYFTEAICGKEGASRTDYTPSANDNFLVRGVSGDKYSLGYFGYAYYVDNRDKLKVIPIAPGSDPATAVEPNETTIRSGTYKPLSRPLFVYVNTKALKRPEVAEFLKFSLNEGQALIDEVGYVRLDENAINQERQKLQQAVGK
ncbi:MAG: PstS family phosphate ABC transporter substrate-binding protein [Planctomycetaceae bacterium]